MNERITLETAEPKHTVVVRRRASISELPQVLPQAYDEVWGFIRSTGLQGTGRNLAVYRESDEEGQYDIECGVEIDQPFTGTDEVVCSQVPGGPVAHLRHVGPYDGLFQAHQDLRAWCAQQGHSLAGTTWELYDHMTEDPSAPVTDVYYLLANAS